MCGVEMLDDIIGCSTGYCLSVGACEAELFTSLSAAWMPFELRRSGEKARSTARKREREMAGAVSRAPLLAYAEPVATPQVSSHFPLLTTVSRNTSRTQPTCTNPRVLADSPGVAPNELVRALALLPAKPPFFSIICYLHLASQLNLARNGLH
jgi:hypothetical protein